MAVTKRTRFEVLRRDNYTCRYCRSTDGALTVDHVTPRSLGGSDDPSNLVACCDGLHSEFGKAHADFATRRRLDDELEATLRNPFQMGVTRDVTRD